MFDYATTWYKTSRVALDFEYMTEGDRCQHDNTCMLFTTYDYLEMYPQEVWGTVFKGCNELKSYVCKFS